MSVINLCLKTSDFIKDNRTRLQTFAHIGEELGELAQELLIDECGSYKKPDEGVIAEALDLITCAVDLIYLTKPDITEDQLIQMLKPKLAKWLSNHEKATTVKYPYYLGQFDTDADVAREFSEHKYERPGEYSDVPMDGVEILLAYYEYQDYSGNAFVLFRKDEQLYEVNGSHCSCYGLEGQWDPEETTVSALQHRLEKGSLGYYNTWSDEGRVSVFAIELRDTLNSLDKEGYL